VAKLLHCSVVVHPRADSSDAASGSLSLLGSLAIVAASAIGLTASIVQPPPQRSSPVLVQRVIDGDTIEVANIGRVQLLGIDAPELAARYETSKPDARAAWERLSGLLTSRWVRLEFETGPRAKSPQRAAYVLLEDGLCVNEWMVREGLARVAPREGLRRLADLQRAELDARSARRGLWRNPAPAR
jgi:endonuclease YncB( thermonuclease family)